MTDTLDWLEGLHGTGDNHGYYRNVLWLPAMKVIRAHRALRDAAGIIAVMIQTGARITSDCPEWMAFEKALRNEDDTAFLTAAEALKEGE